MASKLNVVISVSATDADTGKGYVDYVHTFHDLPYDAFVGLEETLHNAQGTLIAIGKQIAPDKAAAAGNASSTAAHSKS